MTTVLALFFLDYIPFVVLFQLVVILLLMVIGVLGVMVLFRAFRLLGVHAKLAKQRLHQAETPEPIAVQHAEA